MSKEIEQSVQGFLDQHGVKCEARYIGEKRKALGGEATMDEWRVTFIKGAEVQDFDYFTGLGLRAKTPIRPWQTLEGLKRPVTPTAAAMLHCLVLDSVALNMGFDEWCSDFGYSSDSIKASKIFEACRDNSRKLARIFNSEQLEKLSELLQDY
jgi:hypothetical protein